MGAQKPPILAPSRKRLWKLFPWTYRPMHDFVEPQRFILSAETKKSVYIWVLGCAVAQNVILTTFFRRALAPLKMLQKMVLRGPRLRHDIISWGQSLTIFPNLAILRDFLTSFSRLWFFRVLFDTFWPFLVKNSNY